MKIYQLTRTGEGLSHSIVSSPSPAMSIIYWMKRHGSRATDEQIKAHVVDGEAFVLAINKLQHNGAVTVVG